MPAIAWGSLAFLVVASVAGIAFAATRGLDTWRALRGLQRRLEPEVADVSERVAAMESRLAAAPASTARLEEATARLRGVDRGGEDHRRRRAGRPRVSARAEARCAS